MGGEGKVLEDMCALMALKTAMGATSEAPLMSS